jgi:signal transduction histidine kinase
MNLRPVGDAGPRARFTVQPWLVLLLGGLCAYGKRLSDSNRELIRANREGQRSNELEHRLVASLSHELRTPLNAVLGFSELMLDGRTGPLSDAQHEHLGIINSSAEHMLRLVNDLLDRAQLQAGQIRLAPQPIEPAEVVGECIRSLRQAAADHEVTVEFDRAPIGTARLDPVRLRQVVLNFLTNAIKFTGRGGTVTIGLYRERGRVLIEITDTGPGIALADQGRAFEAFMSLPGVPRDGTGLGLAITKLIVEAQGGQVGVRSVVGGGSTFFAWLPVTPAGRSDPPLALVATGTGRRSRARGARPPRRAVARR